VTLAASSRLRRVAGAAVALGCGGPLVIALASLSAHGHRWVDILAQFVGPALVAAVLLLGSAIVLRLWTAGAVAGLTTALVVAAGSPQWFPVRGWPAEEPGFSLYFGNLFAGNDDVEAIAQSIRAADPDVIVMVEVGDAARLGLEDALPGHPYRVFSRRWQAGAGPSVSVIASRWPLKERAIVLPHAFAVAADVSTPSGPVTVVGAHLTRPWPYQYQWAQIIQAQEFVEWRRGVSGPLVVAGDFNSVSSARIGRMIRAEAGLVAAPGWPGTWPAFLPAWMGMTIDQVYRTPDLALLDRRVGRDNGSDHRPVVVRLTKAVPPAS